MVTEGAFLDDWPDMEIGIKLVELVSVERFLNLLTLVTEDLFSFLREIEDHLIIFPLN